MIKYIRTYSLSLYIISCCLLWGVLLVFLYLFKWLIKDFESVVHYHLRNWGKACLIFHKVIIHGRENLLKDSPIIFISNHQSNFDIFLFNGYLDVQFRWLAKKELFKIPIIGHAMKAAGYISVDRGNHQAAVHSINVASEKLNRNNISIIIFPEGTWGLSNGEMRPYKKGGFHLAKATNAPIIPITIIDSCKINPTSPKYIINFGKIEMYICPPIYPEEYNKYEINELSNHIRSIIQKNLDSFQIK